MYRTCLFCQSDLGDNEALEAFPVGRRLAFDAAQGRLWVICPGCERWNLTPLEERWEAIEQAERLFRATRLRASSDHVGLARLRDGSELVRVGRPLRPEFAAWRYGDQFGRRRVRYGYVAAALGVAYPVSQALALAGRHWGLIGAGALSAAAPLLQLAHFGHERHVRRRQRVAVRLPAVSAPVRLDAGALACVQLHEMDRDRYVLRFHLADGVDGRSRACAVDVWGGAALRAAAQVLPKINLAGGARRAVSDAVARLEDAGSAEALLQAAGRADRARARRAGYAPKAHGVRLAALPPAERLALEMAAHEEQERRAMEGELHELERAWRDAEEVAAIADRLLLPAGLTERLDQLRGRISARAGAASSPSSSSGGASSS